MFVLAAHALPQQARILDALSTAQVFFPIALCVIGALLMIFGFKAYRWIVLLNCAAMGYWVGRMIALAHVPEANAAGAHATHDQTDVIVIVMSIVGAVLLGVLAMPLMKYASAICGGLVGAVIGMVVWVYFEQPVEMAWAGGLVGLAVLGMLSFILFKTSVILFTSIEGAAMVVLGASALLMRHKPWEKQVSSSLSQPVFVPLLVIAVAALALFWQHQRHGLIGHEGAPGGAGGGGSAKGNSGGETKKK